MGREIARPAGLLLRSSIMAARWCCAVPRGACSCRAFQRCGVAASLHRPLTDLLASRGGLLALILRDDTERPEDGSEAARRVDELEERAERPVRGEQTLEGAIRAPERGEVYSSVEGVSIALD